MQVAGLTIESMRAVVFAQFSVRPRLQEISAPAAPDAGVVIDVEATGVCRSDHHAWAGHDSTITLPHVPGHELVGRVASVGAHVQEFHVGQRVTVPLDRKSTRLNSSHVRKSRMPSSA